MSDCSRRAWRAPRWADAVYTSPAGRKIHMGQPEDAHEAEFELSDGTTRLYHWAGPRVRGMKIDGERWAPVPTADWEDRCEMD